ncbi:MAG: hypothetical protein LUC89_02735 [Oscillospiraceae bacterium]|nr:hypothetical protein [Oscillospiraceae bacterium]
MEKITLTGVPETMLQTVFARTLLPGFAFAEEHSLVEGMEIIAPVYRVIGKLPLVRNLPNRIVVLAREGKAK